MTLVSYRCLNLNNRYQITIYYYILYCTKRVKANMVVSENEGRNCPQRPIIAVLSNVVRLFQFCHRCVFGSRLVCILSCHHFNDFSVLFNNGSFRYLSVSIITAADELLIFLVERSKLRVNCRVGDVLLYLKTMVLIMQLGMWFFCKMVLGFFKLNYFRVFLFFKPRI